MENNKSRLAAILAYITWIGWIIALLIRDKKDSFTTLHLNQALVAAALEIIGAILVPIPVLGILGFVLEIAAGILAIWGLIRAVTGNDKPLPYIGGISVIK